MRILSGLSVLLYFYTSSSKKNYRAIFNSGYYLLQDPL